MLAAGVVFMHAVQGLGPAAQAPSQTSALATATAPALANEDSAAAATSRSGHAPADASSSHSSQESGHDCPHCNGAHAASDLGHLCLAVIGGLLLAGALSWAQRRHRLPALDLDLRLREHRLVLPARAVLGVPPWTHLSLAQLSLLRV